MEALRKESRSIKSRLIAFTSNDGGNAFWNTIGWTGRREDLNYYDFTLNASRTLPHLIRAHKRTDNKKGGKHMEIITGGVTAAKGFEAASVDSSRYQI